MLESLSSDQRDAFLDSLPDDQVLGLHYDWRGAWARPEQLTPDGDWLVWLILCGRGWGKTRTGAEATIDAAQDPDGCGGRILLIGATAGDVRDVMVEGESGILQCSRPDFMPHYEPSKLRLTWPNGVVATVRSADKPERLRGPQCGWFWCDEAAAWRYLDEAWDNLMFGVRLGRARGVVTTTPKPRHLLRQLVKAPTTKLTSGSSYDNLQNLARSYRVNVLAKYAGTAKGQQEIEARLLDQAAGALWVRAKIEELRVSAAPDLVRIVVGVDPAVSNHEDSDETGIVVKGIGWDRHLYTLADLSGRYSPSGWAKRATDALKLWKADRIVAEANNGGDMVASTIRTSFPDAPVSLVHASRGKLTRAEPIAALHEQGREHHVGVFPQLEDQKCNWVPGSDESPDRLDADVWASTALLDETSEAVAASGGGGSSEWPQA